MEKIIFQVVIVGDEKLFYIGSDKKNLFLNKILPIWFEGYYHFTKCQIFRNNEPYDDSYINCYGTHCASEYFFGFKIITAERMISEILAERLEVGDVVEIENVDGENCQNYVDANQFINFVTRFQKFSESFDKSFEINNGKLSKEEFIKALVTSAISSTKNINKRVIVARW